MATTRFERAGPAGDDAAEKSRAYVRRHWRFAGPAPAPSPPPSGPGNLFERIRTHAFCISGMAFQDAWNIDLERLRRCCIHVASETRGLVPFCAWYLTDTRGRAL
ncbi:MAG: radical SAM protein, partial [Acidobacteria bacterium]|nr:radical SAM protein [Acidobacteriota bacterium]